MTQDKNKGVTAITYNHLNLPVQVNKGASDYIVYTYDATGRKLTQQVFGSAPKVTDYIGELLFEGTTPVLKQISHSEGRVLPDGANWEYQYHLKDHLGSIRATFTTKTQTPATSTANFEAATNTNFTNYFRTSFDLVDHTDAGTTYTHVQHLNGGVNGRVGIGKSISVLPGDKVSIGAWAKYMNLGSTTNTTAFITALATAFGTSSMATGELGKLYNGLNSYATAVPNGNHPDDDETAPKAFVTILLFDKDYNLVDAAWKQITTVGLQSSPTVKQPPHDYLFKEVTVREPGFAYVFVSNEHPTYVDVYFDDVTVTHTPSPIVSSSDYFAFGLQHTTGERAGVYEQRTLFQSQELQDELNLGWVQFKWRNHDSSIGRFFNVDPIAEKYYYNSTYAFSENKVTNAIELEGLESVVVTNVYGADGQLTEIKKETHLKSNDFGPLGKGTYTANKYSDGTFSESFEPGKGNSIASFSGEGISQEDFYKEGGTYGGFENRLNARLIEGSVENALIELGFNPSDVRADVQVLENADKKFLGKFAQFGGDSFNKYESAFKSDGQPSAPHKSTNSMISKTVIGNSDTRIKNYDGAVSRTDNIPSHIGLVRDGWIDHRSEALRAIMNPSKVNIGAENASRIKSYFDSQK